MKTPPKPPPGPRSNSVRVSLADARDSTRIRNALHLNRKVFAAAAKADRGYVARVGETLTAVVLFLENPSPTDTEAIEQEEVVCLFADPDIEFEIVVRLLQAAIIRRAADFNEHRWSAIASSHLLQRALERSGFQASDEVIELNPAQFGGALDHMLNKDATRVRARRYDFIPQNVDQVIGDLHKFLEAGSAASYGSKTLKFFFDIKVVQPDALKQHVRLVGDRRQGGVPAPARTASGIKPWLKKVLIEHTLSMKTDLGEFKITTPNAILAGIIALSVFFMVGAFALATHIKPDQHDIPRIEQSTATTSASRLPWDPSSP